MKDIKIDFYLIKRNLLISRLISKQIGIRHQSQGSGNLTKKKVKELHRRIKDFITGEKMNLSN